MTTLRKGAKGEEVKTLQRLLGIAVDGVFGTYTEKAVRELQLKSGLSVDGVVGTKTWDILLGNSKPKNTNTLTGAKGTRAITRIFVHATASNQKTTTVSTLKAEFKARGWNSPGYHYVVFPDGRVEQLLSESGVANGVKGYNSNSVHVSWVGGYNGVDNRTTAQKLTLIKVLKELRVKYPTAKILGHRDISPDKNHNGVVDPWERIKECPCFEAQVEYRGI